MKELKFDGERVVPNKTTPNHLLKEHFDRYLFAKKFVKDKVVLDIACGTGYGSFELSKSGAKKVIGGDISDDAISYATEKYKRKNLSFKKINGESMGILTNAIDLVVSFETIE
ncbi:MAG: class I SAM-dependent methyltransferase, partial [Nanoarchaeota archaeon]|nr:class I SAM-dependent methyltransferase [Nanoarchaeota archaeon]